ncbi:EcsC family protein [Desulfosporosinus fructosivorans]|uniref:EcsC family protein n=1 Tax=Desulfosporosinus fructosivorans TaxID=2018669 RepID=UPI001FB10448|nr:EcsC family protein [Desulfosporosinus fructosivorans]
MPTNNNSIQAEQTYKEHVRVDLDRWVRRLLKRPGLLERTSKVLQTKVNDKIIPKKVHTVITATVKGLVKSVVFGLDYIPKSPALERISLQERDQLAEMLLVKYRKIAAAEGAGTGAGGFTLAIADFPVLIAIKMKFLFELAHIYGFPTADYRERLFLLYIFQLTFSSQEKRFELFKVIQNWEENVGSWPVEDGHIQQQIDWEQFQREYRDAIDFRKTLQLIPGLGAVVGAWANYGLLDELGTVGMNCYRLRIAGGVNFAKSHSKGN